MAPNVAALLQEESRHIQFQRTFSEHNSHVDGEAPLEEIFGHGTPFGLIRNSSDANLPLSEQLKLFMPTTRDETTPMERFSNIHPTDEPFPVYGKLQMQAMNMQLGDAASARTRAQAATILAATTNHAEQVFCSRSTGVNTIIPKYRGNKLAQMRSTVSEPAPVNGADNKDVESEPLSLQDWSNTKKEYSFRG